MCPPVAWRRRALTGPVPLSSSPCVQQRLPPGVAFTVLMKGLQVTLLSLLPTPQIPSAPGKLLSEQGGSLLASVALILMILFSLAPAAPFSAWCLSPFEGRVEIHLPRSSVFPSLQSLEHRSPPYQFSPVSVNSLQTGSRGCSTVTPPDGRGCPGGWSSESPQIRRAGEMLPLAACSRPLSGLGTWSRGCSPTELC